MWKQLIAAVCLLSVLAGSIVGQKQYQGRGIQTPDTFRAGEAFGRDQASIGDLKWFEVFKDEELQKLVRTAMIQNYDLRQAAARINSARANLGLARSDQLPQFEGSSNVTSTRFARDALGSVAGLGQRGFTFTIGEVLLNLLTFELDIWGRLRQRTKAARAELRASEEDRRAAMTTVVGDVATAYFSLLELDGELDIARRTLSTREESLRLIRTREQGGIATMLDVRQGEQLVYQASETIPATEESIEQTENLISLLIGKNPGPIRRGRSLTQQEELPGVPPCLPSSLLERRPDIRSAEQILISRNALIKAARAAYFPTISLTGLLGLQSDQLSNLFTAELNLNLTRRNELLSLVLLYKALGGGWQQ